MEKADAREDRRADAAEETVRRAPTPGPGRAQEVKQYFPPRPVGARSCRILLEARQDDRVPAEMIEGCRRARAAGRIPPKSALSACADLLARTPVRVSSPDSSRGGGDVQEAVANSPDQAVLQKEEVAR